MLLVLGALFLCMGCQKTVVSDEEDTQKETVVDSGIGEGAPKTEILEYEEDAAYQVGDVISLTSSSHEYELCIDAVSYIEATNVHAEVPEQVVLVDYTYTNNSEELLLIDSMRFQLVNPSDDTVYEPYYFEDKITAEPVNKGESFSAQIAFSKNDDSDQLLLIYHDTMDNNLEPVSVIIDTIGNKN